MTSGPVGKFVALVALAALLGATPRANRSAVGTLMPADGQRHHYRVDGRVRALLFWISKEDVGDAVISKKHDPDGVGYALLIGSDPERTPRRINRWGYIAEEIRGDEATVVGLMTQSNEQSAREAEANLRNQGGERTFDVIHASVADGEVRSVLTAVAAPGDYTFHHVDALLDLADRKGVASDTRVIRLPAGARPGFLSALADLMHRQADGWRTTHAVSTGEPIEFTYHGKLYQLRATQSHATTNVRVGNATADHAIASHFQIKNVLTGDLTDFAVTYAVDGPLAEMPLTASYRPAWWIDIQLTLDDASAAPLLVGTRTGINP
jgi:hypothetical protein